MQFALPISQPSEVTVDRNQQASLPPEANELLRELWGEIHGEERQVSRERLRAVARQVSLCAMEKGLRPEELIIAVKESWMSPDGLTEPRERMRLQWVLADTISLCIDEFYLALRDTESRRGVPDRWRRSGPNRVNP